MFLCISSWKESLQIYARPMILWSNTARNKENVNGQTHIHKLQHPSYIVNIILPPCGVLQKYIFSWTSFKVCFRKKYVVQLFHNLVHRDFSSLIRSFAPFTLCNAAVSVLYSNSWRFIVCFLSANGKACPKNALRVLHSIAQIHYASPCQKIFTAAVFLSCVKAQQNTQTGYSVKIFTCFRRLFLLTGWCRIKAVYLKVMY